MHMDFSSHLNGVVHCSASILLGETLRKLWSLLMPSGTMSLASFILKVIACVWVFASFQLVLLIHEI